MKKNVPQIICNIALYVFMAVYLVASIWVLYMFIKDMIEDSSFDISIIAILLTVVILPWALFLLRNKIKSIYFIILCCLGVIALFFVFNYSLGFYFVYEFILFALPLTYLLFGLRFIFKPTRKLFTFLNILYIFLLIVTIAAIAYFGYGICKVIIGILAWAFALSFLLIFYFSWSALFMFCTSVHNVKIKPLAERELFAENDDKEQGGNVEDEVE